MISKFSIKNFNNIKILSYAKKINQWFQGKVGRGWDPRKNWSNDSYEISKYLAFENDIIISTYGPPAAHHIACEMKKINRSLIWIADYRDLWSDHPFLEKISKNTLSKIREEEINTVAKNADFVSTISDQMIEKLSKLTRLPVFKVTNGFDIDLEIVKKNITKKITSKNKPFRIVYTGRVYKQIQDPKPLMDAIYNILETKFLEHGSITIDFYGQGLEYISELIENNKYKSFIRIFGHKKRNEILKIQRDADLLLLLGSESESHRGVITGKIFEYIAAGKPIICIGSKLNFEMSQIINLTGTGITFERNEVSKIQSFILDYFKNQKFDDFYKPKIEKIIKYSRKNIALNFLQLINDLGNNKEKLFNKNDKKQLLEKKNNNIKIFHVISGLNTGGAERFLHNILSSDLIKKKYNNTVISLISEGHYGPLLKKAGINVVTLDMKYGSLNLGPIWKFYRILKKQKPEILQGWMYNGNLVALLGKLFFSKKSKLAWNIRLTLEIFLEMKLFTRVSIKLGKFFSSIPNSIIYNSNRSIDQHESLGFKNNKNIFVPNGFDVDEWRPNDLNKNKVREKLSIPKNAIVFGYVGRGDYQKDLPNLFKAFEAVCKNNLNIFLIAVGRKLDQYGYNSDQIKFLGEREDVSNIMNIFDIFCLSSRAEGFPNAIGEAMSCGIPCIATDVGDTKFIIGETGWVVPPRNTPKLIEAMNLALQLSEDQLKILGKKARKRIIDHFSISLIEKQYDQFYKELLYKK